MDNVSDPIHMIKLVVGIDSLREYFNLHHLHPVTYHGSTAFPCWTRHKPKRADAMLDSGGSIYRVINKRIMCRHRILGFEVMDTLEKGTMCCIMQSAVTVRTAPLPRRPFQGWRYLSTADAPVDIGEYDGHAISDDDNAALLAELAQAGLL